MILLLFFTYSLKKCFDSVESKVLHIRTLSFLSLGNVRYYNLHHLQSNVLDGTFSNKYHILISFVMTQLFTLYYLVLGITLPDFTSLLGLTLKKRYEFRILYISTFTFLSTSDVRCYTFHEFH